MRYFIFLLFTTLAFSSCNDKTYTPKPLGYIELSVPEHAYDTFNQACPFVFAMAKEAQIVPYPGKSKDSYCWFNIVYPNLKATVYCTYGQLNNNLENYLNDSHELVYKHVVKSSAINESYIHDTVQKVFGTLYELKGDVASPYQFYLTDSTKHFFRASLYFDYKANYDSVAPILNYLQEDMVHLAESFQWK